MARKKKQRGRPVEYQMPAPIPDASTEEIAEVVLRANPPKGCRYMEEAEQRKQSRTKAQESDYEASIE